MPATDEKSELLASIDYLQAYHTGEYNGKIVDSLAGAKIYR
jgi:hypothetical protein